MDMQPRPSGLQIPPEVRKKMVRRGWTPDGVESAVRTPVRVQKTMDRRHLRDQPDRLREPATAYYYEGGGYVVINDARHEVIQVSDRNNPDWRAPWDD